MLKRVELVVAILWHNGEIGTEIANMFNKFDEIKAYAYRSSVIHPYNYILSIIRTKHLRQASV